MFCSVIDKPLGKATQTKQASGSPPKRYEKEETGHGHTQLSVLLWGMKCFFSLAYAAQNWALELFILQDGTWDLNLAVFMDYDSIFLYNETL